ncbi:uncharacterized protein LOC135340567 [Halichondria panicea]|uniref:uncharacterized protein LOC135340567 n=1 Tax=Halichondria panicea TaxID=6063 RepID=UPI00312B966C
MAEERKWERKLEEQSHRYSEEQKITAATFEHVDEPQPTGRFKVDDARALVIKTVMKATERREFQKECGILKTKLYEGGSVKQGTAVPGCFDIDLVLFSKDLKSIDCIKNKGYPETLEKVDEYFEKQFQEKYHCEDKQGVTVKFTYKLTDDRKITVKLSFSCYWDPGKPEELFDMLETIDSHEIRELFIPGTFKMQSDFIKCVDPENHPRGNHRTCQNIHHLIKRAKKWRNKQDWTVHTEHGDLHGEPGSYLISLLVITAHFHVEEKFGEYGSKTQHFRQYTARVTDEFKRIVKQIGEKEDFGPVPFKAKDSGLKMIREKYSHLLPAPWWLIDPANPANNVYISGMSGWRKDKGWQEFATKVDNIDLTIDVQQQ